MIHQSCVHNPLVSSDKEEEEKRKQNPPKFLFKDICPKLQNRISGVSTCPIDQANK